GQKYVLQSFSLSDGATLIASREWGNRNGLGWPPEAPFHFADGVDAAMTTAQELAGDRTVEVAAGDVGGQMMAAGLVDEVAMDVAPVVLGTGKRFFGSVTAQHLLEDPDVVIAGNRVLHLRYRVRR